jgi:hypothetical protein
MSERRTVYPFVLRGDNNREFLIAMTVKATVNNTKCLQTARKFFPEKKAENHNSTHIYLGPLEFCV